jgi:hypothetical protein
MIYIYAQQFSIIIIRTNFLVGENLKIENYMYKYNTCYIYITRNLTHPDYDQCCNLQQSINSWSK